MGKRKWERGEEKREYKGKEEKRGGEKGWA